MGNIGPTRARYEVLPVDDLEVALPLDTAPSADPSDGALARGSEPSPEDAVER